MLYIIYAHFLADFVLQADYIAKNKKDNFYILFVHSFIYSVTICFVYKYYLIYTIYKFVVILVSHFIIDYIKANARQKKIYFYLDQILHILINIILFIK